MAADQASAIATARPIAPEIRNPPDWPVTTRLVQPTSATVVPITAR
jgi:hypothetical protein